MEALLGMTDEDRGSVLRSTNDDQPGRGKEASTDDAQPHPQRLYLFRKDQPLT